MMTDTQVYLHSHAADALARLANTSRVSQFIEQLRLQPETVGDYRLPDPKGRMIEVKILGRHALLFFKDPFAGIVKILDLRNTEAL